MSKPTLDFIFGAICIVLALAAVAATLYYGLYDPIVRMINFPDATTIALSAVQIVCVIIVGRVAASALFITAIANFKGDI